MKRTEDDYGSGYSPAKKKAIAPLNIVGPNVRRLRRKRGWTQFELALRLKLAGYVGSRCHVSKIESQLIRVNDAELYFLAKVLGAALPELFPPVVESKMVRKRMVCLFRKSGCKIPPEPRGKVYQSLRPKWTRWQRSLSQQFCTLRRVVRHCIGQVKGIRLVRWERLRQKAPAQQRRSLRGVAIGNGVAETSGAAVGSNEEKGA